MLAGIAGMKAAAEAHSRAARGASLAPYFELTESIIDLHSRIASEFFWLNQLPALTDWPRSSPATWSAVVKGGFYALSALHLTAIGHYGSARALMRPIFEGSLLAKYCSVRGDTQVFDRWSAGRYVPIERAILSRISHPSPQPLRELWNSLCEFSHATIYASQLRLESTPEEREVRKNTVLLCILLQCQYHLVSRFICTRKAEYETRQYSDSYDIPALRTEIRLRFQQARSIMAPAARTVVASFKATWRLS